MPHQVNLEYIMKAYHVDYRCIDTNKKLQALAAKRVNNENNEQLNLVENEVLDVVRECVIKWQRAGTEGIDKHLEHV